MFTFLMKLCYSCCCVEHHKCVILANELYTLQNIFGLKNKIVRLFKTKFSNMYFLIIQSLIS